MFSTEHFIWIGICALFITLMTVIAKKKSFSLKLSGGIMCVICALSETSKIMSDIKQSENGGVLMPTSLPFHLCSLMIFTTIFITFGKDGKIKQAVIDFVSVMGILGSICAILIPTNGTDFADIGSYQCFVYHAGLLWFSLYLIVSGKAKLGIRTLARNMLILLCLAWAMIYINSALSVYNTNFMYLVRPPMKDLPFLTLEYGWYVYFAHIVSLAVILISLFHLPFIIIEKTRAKKEKRSKICQ